MPAIQEKTQSLQLSPKERTALDTALHHHQEQLEETIRWFDEPDDKANLKLIRAIRRRLKLTYA